MAGIEYFEGLQTAYCPKFDERRHIWIRIGKANPFGAPPMYGCTTIDCPDYNECEFVDDKRECPFIVETLEKFIRNQY